MSLDTPDVPEFSQAECPACGRDVTHRLERWYLASGNVPYPTYQCTACGAEHDGDRVGAWE